MVRCEVCDSEFGSNSTLLRHMRTKHGSVMFQCEHCEFKCNRKDSLTRHLVKHSESRKRKLEPEPEKSKQRKIEPEPEKSKRKRYYGDDEVFYSDDDMDDNIPTLPELEDMNIPSLPELEDMNIPTLSELEDMMEEIDFQQSLNLTDSDLQMILELDPEDSRTNKQLEPEKEKLSGKGIEKESNVFKCNDCDATFLHKKSLYRHNRRNHEDNFLCETCGKHFPRRDVYEKHQCHVKEKVKTRHNLNFDENAAAADENDKESTTSSAFNGLFNSKTWRIRQATDPLSLIKKYHPHILRFMIQLLTEKGPIKLNIVMEITMVKMDKKID